MQNNKIVPASLALALCCSGAFAQSGNYPARVIKFIVPVAAGGTVDIVARAVAQRLTESLGQQVIVENRPSASSLVGTLAVAKSAPDGYTLLASSTTFLSAPAVVRDPGYDPIKDFAPITLTCRVPMVLDVSPNLHARSIKEFIALAKARPEIGRAHV